MKHTTARTSVNIPAVPTPNPFIIASAWQHAAVRVLVENNGAVLLFIALSPDAASKPEGPTSDSHQLPPGQSRVFVLAPAQRLYAAGLGVGGQASISVSELTLEDLASIANGTT